MQIFKLCEWCHTKFSFRSVGPQNNAKRRFCANPCAASWRNAQPGRAEAFNEWMTGIRGVVLRGRSSPQSSVRMKANNPMSKPETVEKMRSKLLGRTFLARGGNSKLTKPQLLVATSLGLPTEVAIATREVRADFDSLPPCYKVDIASVPHRLAIEIDGKTHRLKKWKFLDRRKTEVLAALGWTVIRFWNEEVENDFDRVLSNIKHYLETMPVVERSSNV
ncbi:DUF559 domain-containing protein [Massilia aurea]|uniref:endonuclease domain-containing protein n=1 Tax=Massilia aurea TaxID=373040 RepID=UPI0034632661